MYEKKKTYSYCMHEKLHSKLFYFAIKNKYRSLSDFFAKIGQAEIDRDKGKKVK